MQRLLGIAAGPRDETADQSLGIVQQRLQEMLGRDLGIVVADRDGLRGLDEFLEAVGKLLEIHELVPLARPSVTMGLEAATAAP